jgi:hypothetical protein
MNKVRILISVTPEEEKLFNEKADLFRLTRNELIVSAAYNFLTGNTEIRYLGRLSRKKLVKEIYDKIVEETGNEFVRRRDLVLRALKESDYSESPIYESVNYLIDTGYFMLNNKKLKKISN